LDIKELPANILLSFSLGKFAETETKLDLTGSQLWKHSYPSQGAHYGHHMYEDDYGYDDIPIKHSAACQCSECKPPLLEKPKENVVPLLPAQPKPSVPQPKKWEKREIEDLPSICTLGQAPEYYSVGDNITFSPYDIKDVNAKKDLFKLIGRRIDMDPKIEIIAHVLGKQKVDLLLEETLIGSEITRICSVKLIGQPHKICVWVKEPDIIVTTKDAIH